MLVTELSGKKQMLVRRNTVAMKLAEVLSAFL